MLIDFCLIELLSYKENAVTQSSRVTAARMRLNEKIGIQNMAHRIHACINTLIVIKIKVIIYDKESITTMHRFIDIYRLTSV